jgi:hypothetical protein
VNPVDFPLLHADKFALQNIRIVKSRHFCRSHDTKVVKEKKKALNEIIRNKRERKMNETKEETSKETMALS